MSLVTDLLGKTLLELDRAYWAVKLRNGTWVCEARIHVDQSTGILRYFDWSNDLVANSDVLNIRELWLFCPSNKHSALGNTARLIIEEPGTAFQLKVGTVDSNIATSIKTTQAQIIGKVTNKETGACECFIWDYAQQGLLTPETAIFNRDAQAIQTDQQGNICYAGKTSVYAFHSWNPGSIAPLGQLHLPTLGVTL